jgi:hypothetical protein
LTRAFSLIWLSFQGMPVMTSNSAAAPADWHVGGDAPDHVRVALATPDGTCWTVIDSELRKRRTPTDGNEDGRTHRENASFLVESLF